MDSLAICVVPCVFWSYPHENISNIIDATVDVANFVVIASPFPTMKTHLRVARPTNDFNALLPFYHEGLGFEIIDSFQDHAGFDGIMLGHPDWSYHLEFTQYHGHTTGRAPSQEHLLVFYIPDLDTWKIAIQRMRNCGYEPVPAFNPYWDLHGKTFEDADGYRVVLQNAVWTNEKPAAS